MGLFGSLETLQAQAPRTENFKTALAYVGELLRPGSPVQARLRAIEPGKSQKVELAGGVFVMEQVYATKPRAEGFFEAHRNYIDVQVVLEGEEVIEVADAARMQVRDPYVPERDLTVYADTNAASLLRMQPGDGAIFFPADVHMPSLRLGPGASQVRKAVVKVPVE